MSCYITHISIEGLWSEIDIEWPLSSQVNILSGGNGSGKSTILRCLADMFRDGALSQKRQCMVDVITVKFSDGTEISSRTKFDPRRYNAQVISTFDMTLRESEAISKLSSGAVVTELDWELYRLHTAYLDYQLEISKEVISALTKSQPTEEIIARRVVFFDMVDSLFEDTGKRIDRESNSLGFTLSGCRHITPYQLSSGEKQMLIILTSVLVRNRRPGIMIMDEPEISLHFDWQRRMIEDILMLNPNLQLIIATHSPAVVMNGWVDRVSEINDLIKLP